jgi:TonB-dependent SusC/RagA subfamily outer membrane receptor
MRRTLLLFALISCSLFANAQNSGKRFADIILALDSMQSNLPVEKAHLHIDKPYYSVGDTIWLKAYVTDQSNRLSDLSKIIRVELISGNDSVQTSLAMPITNGQTWGAVTLYDSVFAAGAYTLRAYTAPMRNFDDEYIFNRSIIIGNALPSSTNTLANQPASSVGAITADKTKNGADEISLSFFPEGGSLISNTASTIAFKAIGKDGLSRNVNGYIEDENGTKVTAFATEHAGMGTFKLFAKAGSAYIAVINGTEKRIPLPHTQNEGYSLAASQDKNNIFIKIISSASISDTDTVNFVAQVNNEVLYTGKTTLKGHGLTTTIPRNRFPNGIVQLTLFDKTFSPVAERLLFVKHNDQKIQLSLTDTAADSQKPGTKRFKLLATDAAGKPVHGAFSVAVTNPGKVAYDENNEISIFSNLLLTSDLKGYIEQPNYYFTDTAKEKHLDNLLLTQGWRRFIWQDVLARKYKTPLFKPEQGNVTGVVTNAKKQPVAGAHVSFFVRGGDAIALDTVTDAQGRFVFEGVFLNREEDFLITATDEKGKTKFIVTPDKPETVTPPKIVRSPVLPYTGFLNYLESASKDYKELQELGLLNTEKMLDEVNVAEKKLPAVKEAALKHSANLSGKGKASAVITFLDLLPCGGITDLAGCLISIGKLNNIFYDASKGQFFARQANDPLWGGSPMAIVVNGAPAQAGYQGSMSEIASIEILKSTAYSAIYGSRGGGGAIVITTKTGDVDYNAYVREFYGGKNAKKKLQLSANSYAPRREFYTPAYGAITSRIDLRSTIYWQPNVVTDKDGRATIEFAVGDAADNYRMVLEGISVNGQLGRKVFNYSSK